MNWKPKKRRLLVCLLLRQLELGEDRLLEVLISNKAVSKEEGQVDLLNQQGVVPVEDLEDLLIKEMEEEVNR